MVKQVLGAPGEDRWVSDRGELRIQRPTSLVLLYIESGFLEAEFAPLISRAMDTTVLRAPGQPTFFVDGEHLDGYEPAVRTGASQWIKKNSHRITCQHMLVKSRLAKMGLAVASLLLGAVIIGHERRSTFDRALKEAVDATSTYTPRASVA